MAKKLYLKFVDSRFEGEEHSICLNTPRKDLKKQHIDTAIPVLLASGVLDDGVHKYDTFLGAELKETVIEKIA